MGSLGEEIAKEARKWVGVKYRHRGMTMRGCDCSGFLLGVMRKLGFLLNYKLRYYPPDWNLHSGADNFLVEEIGRFAVEIKKSETNPGDVLVFNFGKCNSHAGILVEKGIFVHCYLTGKKVGYGVLKNSIWENRWSKTFRWEKELI